MRASDVRDLTDSELREHIRTARRELFGLRFQHATAELENTASLKRAKREIARALTDPARARTPRKLTMAETENNERTRPRRAPHAPAVEDAARGRQRPRRPPLRASRPEVVAPKERRRRARAGQGGEDPGAQAA